MQVELKRIQQEVGITFIYVTHDQEEAMTMSDRIAVMNRGKYEQLGDPETLYERPTTRFVAGFLGVSNLLGGDRARAPTAAYGNIRLADDTMVLAPPSRGLRARPPSTSACGPRRSVSTTTAIPRRPATTTSTGVVADASYLGVSTQYIVETQSGARVMVYEQNIERTTKDELWARGRPGPPDLVAGPHVRRRRIGRAGRAGGRLTTRSWRRSSQWIATPRARPPISRRRVLAGGAMAGMAAFLAACGTRGTASSASPAAATRAAASASAAAAEPGASASAAGRRRARRDRVARAQLGELDVLHGRRPATTRRSTRPSRASPPSTASVSTTRRSIDGNDEFVATIAAAARRAAWTPAGT